jgi:TolB-like protein/Flp pilus assembly protein TadD
MPAKPNGGRDDELEDLAASLLEGRAVDWERVARTMGEHQRGLLDQLRGIDEIMAASRRERYESDDAGPAPTHWGRWRLVDRIGGGSFGDVFRAHDPQLGRDLAIKLIPTHRGRHAELLAEARLLAQVRDRHVVLVHGVEEHDGRVGILMEYIDGITIEDLLRGHGPLSPDEALLVGRDVVQGLAALHGASILHRDIKSRNVMRETGGRVVLMDLGIGCGMDPGPAIDRLGTPLYAAPELVRGESATRRSDLYAVGVLLFHLVSDAYPVTGDSLEDLAAAHRDRQRVDLRDLCPDVPESFARVVDRALATVPADRHATAGELLQDLVAALGERGSAGRTPRPRPQGLAVLPFRDFSPDARYDYLCEGLAEQIIHGLSGLPGLRVIARSSSFYFKDQLLDLQEIGRRLQIGVVVEGSVRVSGERVRVVARLVDVADARQLWSAQYERDLDDVLQVEDDISQAIVQCLAGQLDLEAPRRIAVSHSTDPRAVHHYLQGRYLFNQGSRDDLEAALHRFQAAVARDPGYALAHAGIATACAYLYSYRCSNCREHLELARTSSRRAVELAPSMAEAHAIRGFVHLLDWEWDDARNALETALACNPDAPLAHHYLAHYLQAVDRLEEAHAAQERCLEFDPISRFAHGWLAVYRLRSGRLVAARRQPDMLDSRPHGPLLIQLVEGQSYILEGKHAEGIARLEEEARRRGSDPIVLAALGWAYGRTGRPGAARRILARLQQQRETARIRPFLLAKVHAGLGERDAAFAWLDRSVEEHDPFLIMLQTDETVANLRGDPRYREILRRIHLA